MSYWLAHVLRRERTKHNIKPSQVAGRVRRDQSVISRLESGRSLPPDVDRYVAAYAELTGAEDGRQLWAEALGLWLEKGERPTIDEPPAEMGTHSRRFTQAVEDTTRRKPKAPGDTAKRPTSTPKRQAGG